MQLNISAPASDAKRNETKQSEALTAPSFSAVRPTTIFNAYKI